MIDVNRVNNMRWKYFIRMVAVHLVSVERLMQPSKCNRFNEPNCAVQLCNFVCRFDLFLETAIQIEIASSCTVDKDRCIASLIINLFVLQRLRWCKIKKSQATRHRLFSIECSTRPAWHQSHLASRIHQTQHNGKLYLTVDSHQQIINTENIRILWKTTFFRQTNTKNNNNKKKPNRIALFDSIVNHWMAMAPCCCLVQFGRFYWFSHCHRCESSSKVQISTVSCIFV